MGGRLHDANNSNPLSQNSTNRKYVDTDVDAGVNQGGLPSFQALQLDAEAILLNALPELSPGLRQAPSAAFRIPPKPHNPSTGPYNDKDIPWPDGPIPDVVRPGQAREAFLAVHDGNPQDHRAILARLLATTQSQNI